AGLQDGLVATAIGKLEPRCSHLVEPVERDQRGNGRELATDGVFGQSVRNVVHKRRTRCRLPRRLRLSCVRVELLVESLWRACVETVAHASGRGAALDSNNLHLDAASVTLMQSQSGKPSAFRS